MKIKNKQMQVKLQLSSKYTLTIQIWKIVKYTKLDIIKNCWMKVSCKSISLIEGWDVN